MADQHSTRTSPEFELGLLEIAEADLARALDGEALAPALEAVERIMLLRAIVKYSGRVSRCVAALGMSKTTFARRCEELYREEPTAPPSAGGWIYVIRDHLGKYKIGKTRLLTNRVAHYRVASSEGIEFIGAIHVADPDAAEVRYHRMFVENWVRGEWFSLTPDDLAKILGEEGTDERRAAERAFETVRPRREFVGRRKSAHIRGVGGS